MLDKILLFLESIVEKLVALYTSYKLGQLTTKQEQLTKELENSKDIKQLTDKVEKMTDEELTQLLTRPKDTLSHKQ